MSLSKNIVLMLETILKEVGEGILPTTLLQSLCLEWICLCYMTIIRWDYSGSCFSLSSVQCGMFVRPKEFLEGIKIIVVMD